MDFTFNENSLLKFENREKTLEILFEFAKLIKTLNEFGLKTILVFKKEEILKFNFNNGFTLNKWFKENRYSSEKERTISQRLRNLFDRSRSIKFDNQISSLSIGLFQASLLKTISVSFNSDEKWNIHEFYFNNNYIRHSSKLDHLDRHLEWFKNTTAKKIEIKSFFPFLDFSDELIENKDWENYRRKILTLNPNEKQAYIIDLGKKIAERNLFNFERRISKKNSNSKKKRIIYSNTVNKKKYYYSIDLETGGFEICDYRGNHLGEYFFDSTKTGEKKINHNCVI